MEPQRPCIAKAILTKNKTGDITCPDFKHIIRLLYGNSMETVWYWNKKRYKDKWKRIKCPWTYVQTEEQS